MQLKTSTAKTNEPGEKLHSHHLPSHRPMKTTPRTAMANQTQTIIYPIRFLAMPNVARPRCKPNAFIGRVQFFLCLPLSGQLSSYRVSSSLAGFFRHDYMLFFHYFYFFPVFWAGSLPGDSGVSVAWSMDCTWRMKSSFCFRLPLPYSRVHPSHRGHWLSGVLGETPASLKTRQLPSGI